MPALVAWLALVPNFLADRHTDAGLLPTTATSDPRLRMNAGDLVQVKGCWLLPANLVDEVLELHIRANSVKLRSDGTRTHARYDDDRATLRDPVVATCDHQHMPAFPINVVASYEPTAPMVPPEYPLLDAGPALRVPDATRDALQAWGKRVIEREDHHGLRATDFAWEEDGSLLPARLTVTVTCEVEAPTEWDARTDALSWFRAECEASALQVPESVVANAE